MSHLSLKVEKKRRNEKNVFFGKVVIQQTNQNVKPPTLPHSQPSIIVVAFSSKECTVYKNVAAAFSGCIRTFYFFLPARSSSRGAIRRFSAHFLFSSFWEEEEGTTERISEDHREEVNTLLLKPKARMGSHSGAA
jgi:hypothetical protein